MSALLGVATEALRLLRDRAARGLVRCPLEAATLGAEGLGAMTEPLLDSLGGLEQSGVIKVLDAVLAERASQRKAEITVVWTGPTTKLDQARDTAVVIDELFARAERRVLVAGYAFDHGARIFAPLHRAMKERGVRAELFVDVRQSAPAELTAVQHATLTIDAFVRDQWPFGEPKPTIYFDPRTAESGSVMSLHAKVVVIDERWTLVGSANFTDRGQRRNLEMGLLVDDPALAHRVVAHWSSLVAARLVERYVG